MKRFIMLTMIFGTMSTMAMAKGGYEDQLTFIPKIAIGENRNDGEDIDFKVNGFAGFNADILYGVTQNLEMGINLGWNQYDMNDTFKEGADIISASARTANYNEKWDKTLDNLNLVGVVRYNFSELDLVTPYVTGRAGWSFGKATGKISDTDGTDYYDLKAEISGRWIAGIAAGIEYENFNVELGYQVTNYETAVEVNSNAGNFDESDKDEIGLIYVSLGYRFE